MPLTQNVGGYVMNAIMHITIQCSIAGSVGSPSSLPNSKVHYDAVASCTAIVAKFLAAAGSSYNTSTTLNYLTRSDLDLGCMESWALFTHLELCHTGGDILTRLVLLVSACYV